MRGGHPHYAAVGGERPTGADGNLVCVPPLDQRNLSPGMWVAIFVSMAGGLVLAVDWFLAIPVEFVLTALIIWAAGIVALGVLTYREGRRNSMGFWGSLGHAIRRFLRGVWELAP